MLTKSYLPLDSLALVVRTSRSDCFLGYWKFLGVRLVRMLVRTVSSRWGRLRSWIYE